MLITLSQIHYHMDHSNMLSCLTVSSHSTNEKLDSSQLPFIYLVVQVQSPFTMVSELLSAIPVGNTFMKHCAYVKILLPLVLKTHSFLKLLRLATFSPNLLSAFISFVCNTVTFFCHGIFHPVIPQTLKCCISICIH